MNSKYLSRIASDLQSITSDLSSLTKAASSKGFYQRDKDLPGKSASRRVSNRVPKKGDYLQKVTTLRGYDFIETELDFYEVDRVEGQIVYLIDEYGEPGQISTRDIGPNKKWFFYDPEYDIQKIEKAYSQLEATAKALKPDLTKMMKLSAKVLGLPSSSVSEQWKSRSRAGFGEKYEQKHMVWEGVIRVKKSATITLRISLSTDIYSNRDTIVANSRVSALAPREVISFLTSVWSKLYLDSIIDAIAKFPARLAEEKDRLGLLSNADL